MLFRSVRTDDKRLARLNLIRDILSRVHYAGKKSTLVKPDFNIASEFTPDCLDPSVSRGETTLRRTHENGRYPS